MRLSLAMADRVYGCNDFTALSWAGEESGYTVGVGAQVANEKRLRITGRRYTHLRLVVRGDERF